MLIIPTIILTFLIICPPTVTFAHLQYFEHRESSIVCDNLTGDCPLKQVKISKWKEKVQLTETIIVMGVCNISDKVTTDMLLLLPI